MSRNIVGLVFVVCMMMASAVFADSIPGIPVTRQQGDWRCWAGASESILKFYIPGFKKSQLEIASVITSKDEEIPKEKIPDCINKNGAEHNVKAQLISKTLSWQEIKKACDDRKPMIILLKWTIAGEYHCNVLAGYIKDSTKIKLMDPIAWTGSAMYYMTWTQLLQGNSKLSNSYWYQTILISGGTPVDGLQQPETRDGALRILIAGNSPGRQPASIVMQGWNRDFSAQLALFTMSGACVY
ncbi:MAG: hypothetical protein JW795_16515, partial [Chitinivibrionales bacterium]|nr:hypothetical protein [Chitinivibrionales bacterium]